jgi:outer membrane protein
MESQLASDEVNVITSQAQYDQAILLLKQLLELDALQSFEVAQPLLDAPLRDAAYGDVNSIYATALTNQPDMKSFEYKLKSAEKGLSIARGGIYPRLSFGGGISTHVQYVQSAGERLHPWRSDSNRL